MIADSTIHLVDIENSIGFNNQCSDKPNRGT